MKYIDIQHTSNYAQQSQQLKTNSFFKNWSHKKSLQNFLQKINDNVTSISRSIRLNKIEQDWNSNQFAMHANKYFV